MTYYGAGGTESCAAWTAESRSKAVHPAQLSRSHQGTEMESRRPSDEILSSKSIPAKFAVNCTSSLMQAVETPI